MNLIKLTIKGISYSQTQNGAYALVLTEMNGNRTLPIVIGTFEAQSIAIALENEIRPPRPLTHDLFKIFSDKFKISITRIVIHKLIDGVFYSNLICQHNGVEEVIDARTSDAIALAVRFQSPIFTYENILDKAGIFLKMNDGIISNELQDDFEVNFLDENDLEDENDFTFLSLQELQNQLTDAITNEDYELAAKLRDEIDKRS